ncbi:hypothetical protein TNCV_716731 [Trichonephila clavipes]|nr:hypothetical protein TNCV_716731 [Trichonephila clavipes]
MRAVLVLRLIWRKVEIRFPSSNITESDRHGGPGVVVWESIVTGSRVFSLTCPLGSLRPELMATLFQPNLRSEV